jgi:2-phospho-L-lactate guanylyltransferase
VSGGTWAVVVARTGPTAKSRLAPILTPGERAALALAMLDDLLAACAGAGLAGTVAVVDSEAGRAVASARGALAGPDPGGDMNAAVRIGLARARSGGAAAAIVLPGDLPCARAEDLAALAASAVAGRAVGIATDHAGTGTNALVLRPSDAIAPSFGPGSAARHRAAAVAAGAAVLTLRRERLARDVDTADDLAALAGLPVGPATAAALARLHPTPAGPREGG